MICAALTDTSANSITLVGNVRLQEGKHAADQELRQSGREADYEHGDVRLVTVDGVTFSRAEMRPGWRWSQDVKPTAGTDSCQTTHLAVVVSGRLHVKIDDGTECDLGPGDAHVVGAGHDAWVIGDEPCIMHDFAVSWGEGVRVATKSA
jgi:mannose-6-phosphate isomerase-like protein (cupin superfamily)